MFRCLLEQDCGDTHDSHLTATEYLDGNAETKTRIKISKIQQQQQQKVIFYILYAYEI
jgi:hypothetical protein